MAEANIGQLKEIAMRALAGKAGTPTPQDILRVAVQLAQEINKIPGLKGRERLEAVVSSLREAIQARGLPAAIQAQLIHVVESIVPEALSMIVDASRGAYDLKRPSIGCIAEVLSLLCRSAASAAPVVAPVLAPVLAPVVAPSPAPVPPVVSEKEVATVVTAATNTDDSPPPATAEQASP
jgi:hypothetical protein